MSGQSGIMYGEPQAARVPDQERIRNAKKKRAQQLKEWQDYDKKMEKESLKKNPKQGGIHSARAKGVKFQQSLVLLEAASRGDLDEVRRLLHDGVCPDAANEDGLTALHQCCIDDNKELCQLLLRYDANVCARDSEQWTPLHAAAVCGHTEICRLLIDKGADLLALNVDGNMPYDICEHEETLFCIESAMADRGISQEDVDERRRVPELETLKAAEEMYLAKQDLNQMDNQGATMLHLAGAAGYVDVASFLLQWGASLDVLDKDGWRAIHVAACWGQYDIIELLTHYGEDLNAKTAAGETIFDLCEDDLFKQQLYHLRDELEQKRLQTHNNKRTSSQRQSGLTRRRSSTNHRGSSIRRTSMREKNELSRKEAQLEKAGVLLALENGQQENALENGPKTTPSGPGPTMQNGSQAWSVNRLPAAGNNPKPTDLSGGRVMNGTGTGSSVRKQPPESMADGGSGYPGTNKPRPGSISRNHNSVSSIPNTYGGADYTGSIRLTDNSPSTYSLPANMSSQGVPVHNPNAQNWNTNTANSSNPPHRRSDPRLVGLESPSLPVRANVPPNGRVNNFPQHPHHQGNSLPYQHGANPSYPTSPVLSPIYSQPGNPDSMFPGTGTLPRMVGGKQPGRPPLQTNPPVANGGAAFNSNPSRHNAYYGAQSPPNSQNPYSQPSSMMGHNTGGGTISGTTKPRPAVVGSQNAVNNANRHLISQPVMRISQQHPRALISPDRNDQSKHQPSGKCCVLM